MSQNKQNILVFSQKTSTENLVILLWNDLQEAAKDVKILESNSIVKKIKGETHYLTNLNLNFLNAII